jgi:hypothetical protein
MSYALLDTDNQGRDSAKGHQRDLLTTIFGRSESTYVRAFAATLLGKGRKVIVKQSQHLFRNRTQVFDVL